MKRTAIFRAASYRYLRPRLLDPYSPFELAEALKERYHFNEVPTAQQLSHSQPPQPERFVYGKMEVEDRLMRIEEFFIMPSDTKATVLMAATRTSTDDSDRFLSDFSEWARVRFDIDISPAAPPDYQSQLEVVLDRSFNSGFDQFQSLANAVTELVRSYGTKDCPSFELSGFSLHFDQTRADHATACPFSLERRGGAPYGENRYFSQAPLRTSDHEKVLIELEAVFLGLQTRGMAFMEE